MPVVITPKILLPKEEINLNSWAVIACDQFTSEPEYWRELKKLVGESPSTLHMILPEVFLELDNRVKIKTANRMMETYYQSEIFTEQECMVLVERKTPFCERRLGLILAIDLESYEFESGKTAPIIASEHTVAERIPPRVEIREKAPIELPHVLVLIDDEKSEIINHLYRIKREFPVLYDFELNMGGGHLKGYKITDTDHIIHQLMASAETIKMVVGDGNHSLASAKVCWERTKGSLSDKDYHTHPARFALVEVVSLFDEGLTFEPIHRVIFNTKKDFLKKFQKTINGQEFTKFLDGNKTKFINIPSNPFIAIKQIQDFLDEYVKTHKGCKIDYVHGEDSLEKVIKENKKAIGIMMPHLKRDELFPYVKKFGALPRKSFSLGEAIEKRYYMECRRIVK
ncbi:MAG: DUF1015 domain-containing protein [Firmicutes bacterium]|nr:DUF1015 domain-containing protein [Bacillota bacterium]